MANQPVVIVYTDRNGRDQVYATAYSPEQAVEVELDVAARGYTNLRVMSATLPTNTSR